MVTKTGTINGVFGVQDTSGVLAPAFGTLESGAYVVQKDATPVAKHVQLDTHVYVVNIGTGTFTPKVTPVVNAAAGSLFLVQPDGTLTAAQILAAVETFLAANGRNMAGGAGGSGATTVSATAPSVTTAAAITMA